MSNYTIKHPNSVLGYIPECINITDFSIILGASDGFDIRFDINVTDPEPMIWRRDGCGNHKGLEYYSVCGGIEQENWFAIRCGVVMPVSVYDFQVRLNCREICKISDDFIEIEYGYYPQTIAKLQVQNKLDDLFQKKNYCQLVIHIQ